MPELRKTKIICTLGPSVDDEETLRQLILAGQGSSDSAMTVIGMFIGAALAHNFGLAASGTALNAETQEVVAGAVPFYGKAAVIICIAVCFIIAFANKRSEGK